MRKLAVLHTDATAYAAEIVFTALVRSFTSAQIVRVNYDQLGSLPHAAVLIEPDDRRHALVRNLLGAGRKVLALGSLGPRVAEELGLALVDEPGYPADLSLASPDPSRHHDESAGRVKYFDKHPLALLAPLRVRPLTRFDFADEWNNLGFGRIESDGGPWSISANVQATEATPIATVDDARDGEVTLYAAVQDRADAAALWINRPVGPVDSLEWRLVEAFLGDYRPEELITFPYLSEVPRGYRGGVVMRLDCDEAIAASRPLVDLYRQAGVPLSLAILTGQQSDGADERLLAEVVVNGGSILSHSVHHYPNWGGSYHVALEEAEGSKEWLEQRVPAAAPVEYAVSPFHQNPPYAVQALADTGYQGFVGGIIANDPEYLLGRAGRVPFAQSHLVSHSAQCMLHGDCFHRYGNRIDTYVQSFEMHLAAGALFGYLDHPFSSRYQYGWNDESERTGVHRQLLERLRREPGLWWPNLVTLMQYLSRRNGCRVGVEDEGRLVSDLVPGAEIPGICWQGKPDVVSASVS